LESASDTSANGIYRSIRNSNMQPLDTATINRELGWAQSIGLNWRRSTAA
jgi:hypothetical protein